MSSHSNTPNSDLNGMLTGLISGLVSTVLTGVVNHYVVQPVIQKGVNKIVPPAEWRELDPTPEDIDKVIDEVIDSEENADDTE